MSFRFHALFLYISLYNVLLQNNVYARTLEQTKLLQRLGFSWGNCGPNTDPIRLVSLSIDPDPIRLPGNVIIFASVNITKPFPVDVHAKVDMRKNIDGIYIKIPCEHDVGSCTYNVCTNKTALYPEVFVNDNASKQCPSIPPATYSVSNLVMNITKSIPSIAEGAFRITVNFDSTYTGHLDCLQLSLNLKD